MMEPFAAQSIVTTRGGSAADRLAITLADATGRHWTVSLGPETATALARVLEEFARCAKATSGSPLSPTKMPSGFAIGAGRFERIVLVRFEDDVPYGLAADEARRLGEALIAEAEQLDGAPAPLTQ